MDSKYQTNLLTRFVSLLLFAVLNSFANLASAETVSSGPTIVVVSMANNQRNMFWERGEARIREELRLAGFKVVVAPAIVENESDFKNELKEIAIAHDATASLLVYTAEGNFANLLLYMTYPSDDTEVYKTYRYQISSTEEEVDVAALKAADAVQSAVVGRKLADILGSNTDKEKLSVSSSRDKTPMRPEVRNLAIFASTGAAALALGGVMNWQFLEHKRVAENYKKDTEKRIDDGDFNGAGESDRLARTEGSKANAYLIGASVSYAVGGILAITGAALYLSKRGETRLPQRRVSIVPRPTGFVMEF